MLVPVVVTYVELVLCYLFPAPIREVSPLSDQLSFCIKNVLIGLLIVNGVFVFMGTDILSGFIQYLLPIKKISQKCSDYFSELSRENKSNALDHVIKNKIIKYVRYIQIILTMGVFFFSAHLYANIYMNGKQNNVVNVWINDILQCTKENEVYYHVFTICAAILISISILMTIHQQKRNYEI